MFSRSSASQNKGAIKVELRSFVGLFSFPTSWYSLNSSTHLYNTAPDIARRAFSDDGVVVFLRWLPRHREHPHELVALHISYVSNSN